MRKIRLFTLLVPVLLAVAPLHASAIFQFDEIGNFSYSLNNGLTFAGLPNGTLQLDNTGSGIPGEVLYYNLTPVLNGFMLSNGDVPVGAFGGGIIGDLRFTDLAGQTSGSETCVTGSLSCYMIFYVFDSNGLPADVGKISTAFLTTQVPGTVLGGSGNFTYTVGALTYDGTIVPEPKPISMVVLGLLAFAFLHVCRKAITITT